jgi:exportin-5
MAILQNLCRLFAHPSVIIAEAQVVMWSNVLKQKMILRHTGMVLIVTQLSVKSVFRNILNLDLLIEKSKVLHTNVSLDVTMGLTMLQERLSLVYTQHPVGTDYLTDRGLCTEGTTAYLYHEGITALFDCVIRQLPSSVLDHAEHCQLVHSMIHMVLAYESQDPLIKYRQLWILAAFSKFYVQDGTILTTVFEVLFSSIEFTLSGEFMVR